MVNKPSYGIFESYKELDEANKIYTSLEQKNMLIDKALEHFIARMGPDLEKLIEEVARNPVLKEKWKEYSSLVRRVIPDNPASAFLETAKNTIPHLLNKILKVKPNDEAINSICQKYHVTVAEYQAFMSEHDGDVEGTGKEPTPLMQAVLEERADIIKVLKDLGADVNKGDKAGNSPLKLAALLKKMDIIEVLHACGADIDQPNEKGVSPLSEALRAGHLDLVELLVRCGAQMDQSDKEGRTPLTQAIYAGNLDLVNILLKYGAEVNQPDEEGRIPINQAVRMGNYDLVQLLSQYGALTDQPDKNGRTPMSEAVKAGNLKMMCLLYDQDLSIDLDRSINVYGTSEPFLYFVMNQFPPEKAFVAENLLKKWGADQEYVAEITWRKRLAHAWGIEGDSDLTDKNGEHPITFSLEGMSESVGVKMLSEYVNKFFDAHPSNQRINKGDRVKIKQIFEKNTYTSLNTSDEIFHSVQSNEMTCILGGCTDHAIAITIGKGHLAIGNRGLGAKENTIDFYQIQEHSITQEIIKKLKTRYDDIESFELMIAEITKPLPHLTDKGITHKDQKIGNCVWASSKLFFSIVCTLYADTTTEKALYKNFTSFVRGQVLREYLSTSVPPYRDDTLLAQIERKKGIKFKKILDTISNKSKHVPRDPNYSNPYLSTPE